MAYRRLILGSGPHWPKEPNDTFLDIRKFERVDIAHDLDVTPWPIADNAFESISALHVVEHLKSLLLPFMDECWRILSPGGELYIETPMAGANINLEWADPTHVRCYLPHSFINYFTKIGIDKFGYTDRPWSILYVGCKEGQPDVLVFHGMPIKS